MEQKHTISALVTNRSGVLTRVSGLFARRGYNIESLSVCATEDSQFSRMTIVACADDHILDQMVKQLDKLTDIKKITLAEEKTSIFRELLLVKLRADADVRAQIMQIATIYKAKTVDLSLQSMVLELTGEPDKLDAFLKVAEPFGIIEMARTGVTAIARGDVSIKDTVDYDELI